jgi:SAM-dependent methyltransferase
MFFPEKITLIKPTESVLEIGPGGTPYPRSDVFLELKYDDENEWRAQRGNTDKLITNKPVIYYNGDIFPIRDNEFDYIICSHVIEHVENVEQFFSEIFRVASKGYVEYPTMYYEYLYNFSVHLNLVKLKNGELIYLKKSKTHINDFLSVQSLFYDSLVKGHKTLVDDLKNIMFEGFEYDSPFPVKQATHIQELSWDEYDIPVYKTQKRNLRKLLRQYFEKI